MGSIYSCYEEFMANLLGEDSEEFEAWKNDTSTEALL